MFERTTNTLTRPAFIVDESSVVRDTGRQIDWDLLDARYNHGAAELVLTESVDVGETAVTVEELTKPLKAGDILFFGTRAGFVVTLSGNEAIGQTDIGVAPLPGPLRSGTILKSGAGEFMQLTADAAAEATSITVEALEVAWESGDTAQVPAVDLFLRLTADADVGAESITVDPADQPIENGAVAYYGGVHGRRVGGKYVPAGTWMDLLANGKVVPSALNTGGGVSSYGLLATNADEDSTTDSASGYGMVIQGTVYENLLPESSGSPKVAPTAFKNEVLARGGAWMFLQYADSTAD